MLELPDPRSISAEALHVWRLLAVRAVVDFDMPQADAATQYGVSANTMSQWVSLYREQGEAGLAVQPQGRPPGSGRTLSDEQAQEIRQLVVATLPGDYDTFKAWREGHPNCVDSSQRPFKGRNCARKTEELFRFMEADLYNLQPAIGEVNGLRSNFSMEMIPGEKREFGACDVEIENNKVEPRPEIRGDIARTYRYMNHAYPGRGIISRSNEKLFAAWDKMDPIDDWERERARRIERIQGNRNSFVFSDGEAAAAAPTSATTIIGNRKSKVYHRPDCPSYDQVASHNRVSFASETAARTAGYRLAGNCP